jgi:hypothetical protein
MHLKAHFHIHGHGAVCRRHSRLEIRAPPAMQYIYEIDLSLMQTTRPSSAPATRSPASHVKPIQPLQQQNRRVAAPSSSIRSARTPLRRATGAASSSKIDAFEEEVSGTISRLRLVTSWNWGELSSCSILCKRNAASHPSTADLRVIRLTGLCAGIEMRAYSIAARALRRLVVDAVGQLQALPSSVMPPPPPCTRFDDDEGNATADLNALLKHVQLASSL